MTRERARRRGPDMVSGRQESRCGLRVASTIRGRRWASLLLATLVLSACGKDELQSAQMFDPPEDTGFDPGPGGDGKGYYGTGSPGTGGGGSEETGTVTCADDNKRCGVVLSLADAGYHTVEVFGDFVANGWDEGVALSLIDGTWSVTLAVPYAQDVQYKFLIDGATWTTDPSNRTTVDDGQGAENSLLTGPICTDWTCEPDVIGSFDWRDAIIYFVFVDRFNNGDTGNDGPIGVPMAADWQGGDWAGVTQKIQEGYFADLGVNTLWLSVPLDNTNASGPGTDGAMYSAYHGYWPTRLDRTEEHFGSLQELQELVTTAHESGLKVLFDYAMNHVHQDSPVYAEHPEWFWPNSNGSGGNCVCGQGCGWDGSDARRCWFTPYLPDFDFTNAEARDFSVANALKWIADTDVDGFRLDAVKHIEEQWLLDLRAQVTEDVESRTGEHFFMVGETFTGERNVIADYVDPAMLDGQFDFPLRMELARTVLMRQATMADLAEFMDGNDDYYGPAIMSTFVGNHDLPRAIHLAQTTPLWDSPWADGKDHAWDSRPAAVDELSAYERLANAFTIVLTTKGAPLIYYGDEIGLAGAGDPDNRRFMQWSGYSDGQNQLFDHVKRLTEIRNAHAAMRKGVRTTLVAHDDIFAYRVQYADDEVWVGVNRGDTDATIDGFPDRGLLEELTGSRLRGPSVFVPARTSVILRGL